MRYYNVNNVYDEQNKTAKAVIDRYNNSIDRSLWQVYGSCSPYKVQAFDDCEQLMYKLDGFDLRIIAHNCMQFSCGFLFVDPNTGVVRFCYCTRDYTRFCDYVC